MSQLTVSVISEDRHFKQHAAQMLRACGVPTAILNEQKGTEAVTPDIALVDMRAETGGGMATIEWLRASQPAMAIFAVAASADRDLILQAMRAGANEFFPWETISDTDVSPVMEESFHAAVRRTATRREAASASARPPCKTFVFLGSKGGAGTTTLAVNCAAELARHSKRSTVIVDLKSCLGEVALFLGIRPRFTILDAIENVHRLDAPFLRELVARHATGVDVIAASEQFDRPGAQDTLAIEELLRILTRTYDHIVIDAGNSTSACVVAALYAADSVFLVINPEIPSIRNAQRLIEHLRKLGAGSERVKILLNRTSSNQLVAAAQIEATLGCPITHGFTNDYTAVSSALNSGVPVTLSKNAAIAAEFGLFTRQLLGVPVEVKVRAKRRPFLGLL